MIVANEGEDKNNEAFLGNSCQLIFWNTSNANWTNYF